MDLSLNETAHKLRMTLSLVSWFTRNPVLGCKLECTGAGPTFDDDAVTAFNIALRGEWPNRNVPAGIAVELKKEACGSCGLCSQPLDNLEAAHIERKLKELDHYCQHPLNLILLCPNCHTRYDASSGAITVATIKHAKERLLSRLMESVDRDVRMEKELKQQAKLRLTSSFQDRVAELVSMATGNPTQSVRRLDAVEALIAAAQSLLDAPLTAGFLMGTAIRGEVDSNLDSFEYIDQLAEPLPNRAEFEAALSTEGKVPSAQLIAWAASADAAYECKVCWTICIEFDVLADALVAHWQVLNNRAGAAAEPFDYAAILDETNDAIANSGVQGEDSFDSSGMCNYHDYVFSKND